MKNIEGVMNLKTGKEAWEEKGNAHLKIAIEEAYRNVWNNEKLTREGVYAVAYLLLAREGL